LGVVVRPSDIRQGRRKIIEELAWDLDPASREAVTRVYENWKGEESEEELKRILGKRLTKRFLRAAKS
jgi:predicted phosphoribosyltransferase